MKTWAIIPARGVSAELPHKNIRPLAGRPLLEHSLRHAREAQRVERVVVSTEDAEIAAVARQAGAEVLERPAKLASEDARIEAVITHALDTLCATKEDEPELVVVLQPTSPLREPEDVDAAIEQLVREDADALFSAMEVNGLIWQQSGETLRSMAYRGYKRTRPEDVDAQWAENGSIYVFRPWVLRQLDSRVGGRISVYPMRPENSFHARTQQDFELLEQLLRMRPARRHSREAAARLSTIRAVFFDFDGVMTDNAVHVDQRGEEAVRCSRADGMGIGLLRDAGVYAAVLSKEKNPVVAARCEKLSLPYRQGIDAKLGVLQAWATELGFTREQVAYVGNDVNDLECMGWVGLPIAVADAEPVVRGAALLITPRVGGQGAVRDVCEWLIQARATSVP